MHHLWILSSCVAIAASLVSAPARAAVFDESGRLALESPWSSALDGPDGIEFLDKATSDADFTSDERGLEGEGALIIDDQTRGAMLKLPAAEVEAMRGRRVEITLWTRPEGLELVGYLTASEGLYHGLYPSGRRTSDDWIELTSGPIDAWFGDQAWVDVLLRPGSVYVSFSNQERYRALVDALEVTDLGPALVPDSACSLVNEDQVCGAHGSCFAGRCVDSQRITPAPPPGPTRDAYVATQLGKIETFTGVRAGRARLAQVRSILEAASEEPARAFWAAFAEAHELLIDGHGRPPSTTPTYITSQNLTGICLGPGIADRLPAASFAAGDDAMRPMVFANNPRSPWGATLAPGDVLTSIDGLSVWEWVDLARPLLYYQGDVRGRRALSTREILGAAQRTGATARFERCTIAQRACESSELEVIDVDLSGVFAPFLSGGLPDDAYDLLGDAPPCDLRFSSIVEQPLDRAQWRYLAAARMRGDSTELVINGVPGNTGRSQLGADWERAIINALSTSPDNVLLDQRQGSGGTFQGVGTILAMLMSATDLVTSWTVPAFDVELNASERAALLACHDAPRTSGGCGTAILFEAHELERPLDNAAHARLAVVSGYNVSGNDYLPKMLSYRAAETRFFGYAPTIGAYGYACSFPPEIAETAPMAYQCTDTLFYPGEVTGNSVFESGTGHASEVIYQSQADAIVGVDTLLETARTWIDEGATTPDEGGL